jgi:carboxylesterase type B
LINRTAVIDASFFSKQCPQSPGASLDLAVADNGEGSEDCLFLNVWTPSNATSGPLPVLVWFHGGGYGLGNGRNDPGPLISTSGNRFVVVTTQYRLGAFGFLASDEVHRRGVVNAGLLDQEAALRWVQKYIHHFNGDPDQVTIFGESAGAGSVMLLDVAYGGTLGTSLFRGSIAASPYLPMYVKAIAGWLQKRILTNSTGSTATGTGSRHRHIMLLPRRLAAITMNRTVTGNQPPSLTVSSKPTRLRS